MTPPRPWDTMPAEMRKTVWAIALLPPFLVIPGVLILEWYFAGPSNASAAALVAWFALEIAVVGFLSFRLRRQGKAIAPVRRPVAPEERRHALGNAARIGLTLLVFSVVYLVAIYAVVFGLWPLHESSESGAILMNVILLAVLVGVPVLFSLGARAARLLPRGSFRSREVPPGPR